VKETEDFLRKWRENILLQENIEGTWEPFKPPAGMNKLILVV